MPEKREESNGCAEAERTVTAVHSNPARNRRVATFTPDEIERGM